MSKILVVEDEADIAEEIRKSLCREQHQVEMAADGQAAMDMLAADSFDLIVLDWMLPNHSGIEICKWYRESGASTPILMLTARGDLEDKEIGLDSGADDYLTKPFQLREFLARIRALLRRGTVPSHLVTCGSLEMDLQARKVTRNGEEIKLEPKEFNLLEFLIHHANQAFKAEALVERVWEAGDVSPDAVRVYIRNLRKKLDVPGEQSIISTVHGAGYRVDMR
jgi:OmpR-family two-component system manganese-sensing response regulator